MVMGEVAWLRGEKKKVALNNRLRGLGGKKKVALKRKEFLLRVYGREGSGIEGTLLVVLADLETVLCI